MGRLFLSQSLYLALEVFVVRSGINAGHWITRQLFKGVQHFCDEFVAAGHKIERTRTEPGEIAASPCCTTTSFDTQPASKNCSHNNTMVVSNDCSASRFPPTSPTSPARLWAGRFCRTRAAKFDASKDRDDAHLFLFALVAHPDLDCSR